MTLNKTRNIFLWGMSAIYLFAFSSLYVQIPGLYGDNGILPARLALDKEANSWSELLDDKPTLLKLTPKLGLDIQGGMDLLCLGGILLSFLCLVCQGFRDSISFALLWTLYLSLYQVGQTFLWFQWDILLLEAGFLTIIVAPLQLPFVKWAASRHHDSITMWLIKWLLFRLMFASGVVKLTSHCPTWWGLTALSVHFESQCIPTPLAWYWHQFPEWFMKLSVVATYVIEIIMSFLFFSPLRSMRIVAFWSQILLQMLILTTGNYNFFNFLTIVLCIPLLDDQCFTIGKKKKVPQQSSYSVIWAVVGGIRYIAPVVVYSYIAYHCVKLFNLQLNTSYMSIESKITFTFDDFTKWLELVVPYSIVLGIISLGYEVCLCLMKCFVEEKGMFRRSWSALQCLIVAALAVGMFQISLVPHTVVEHKSYHKLWPEIRRWHDRLDHFQITSSYGLFRSMTGVGGRPEVIIEGSNNYQDGWKAYEFLYKPGNVSTMPPIVAPHQPRLDWQMWFAALGSYQHNPWILNLVYRLLSGEPDVLELIQENPYPNKPPKYIRATLYHYHFTSDRSSKNWWTRQIKSEYIPPITKSDSNFVKYLENQGIFQKKKWKLKTENVISGGVRWIRSLIGQPEGFRFTMSIFTAGISFNLLGFFLF